MTVKQCPYGCEGQYEIDRIHCPICMAMLYEYDIEDNADEGKVQDYTVAYSEADIKKMEAIAAEMDGDNENTHIVDTVLSASPESHQSIEPIRRTRKPKDVKVVIGKRSKKRMQRKLAGVQ